MAISGSHLFDGQRIARVEALIANQPRLRQALGFCTFVVAYGVAYRCGIAFSQPTASPFWFPDSVLLCALLITQPRHWWLLILAIVPIRFLLDGAEIPLWYYSVCVVNDTAKGLIAAWALRAFVSNPLQFASTRDYIVFCAVAVILLPALSAFGGAASLAALGNDFWRAWERWFMGDALAQLVVTPFILYWLIGAPWRSPIPDAKRMLEAGVLAIGLIATCYWSCMAGERSIYLGQLGSYASLPFLFWAAIRFGMLGASGAIAVVAFIAVAIALSGQGPFSGQSAHDVAFSLQNYLLPRAAPLFLIASLLNRSQAAELALRESEMRFREMADTTPMLMWISDRMGGLQFTNQACIDFTGIRLEEQLGDGWLQAMHPDDKEPCLTAWAHAVTSRASFETEYRMRRHDGVWRWMLSAGSPRYAASGEFVGYIGCAIDISDRKNAEELRQSVAHIQPLAAMGELTAAIAHEVRQPLTAMRSNCDAAVHMLEATNPNVKEIRETLADINSDSRLANEVLNRITRFMRKQEKRVEAVDLNEALSDVLRIVKSDARLRNVQIKAELADDLAAVHGDRTQLEQVMLNLIVNGMDAVADAPVELRNLRVSTQSNGDSAEVSVVDCGDGIAQQNLPFIFDSFFTTKGGGLGLGLSVARAIIVEHGGEITALKTIRRAGSPFASQCRSKGYMRLDGRT